LPDFAFWRTVAVMANLIREIDTAAKKAGLAQRKDLAEALGISEGYLSDLMNSRKDFSPATLKKIAVTLQVNIRQARRWQKIGAIRCGWQIGEAA
jgi:transcriptional regulator with XRE-family HTH domain